MDRKNKIACRHYSIKHCKLNNCTQKERQTPTFVASNNTKCLHLMHLEGAHANGCYRGKCCLHLQG
jgi:hypothetical protein